MFLTISGGAMVMLEYKNLKVSWFSIQIYQYLSWNDLVVPIVGCHLASKSRKRGPRGDLAQVILKCQNNILKSFLFDKILLETLVGGVDNTGVNWGQQLHQTLPVGHDVHLGEVRLWRAHRDRLKNGVRRVQLGRVLGLSDQGDLALLGVHLVPVQDGRTAGHDDRVGLLPVLAEAADTVVALQELVNVPQQPGVLLVAEFLHVEIQQHSALHLWRFFFPGSHT